MKKVYLFAILFGAATVFAACGNKAEKKECCQEGEKKECCKEECKEGEHECCKAKKIDAIIERLEAACAAGDAELAEKIGAELDQFEEADLNEDQLARLFQAAVVLQEKLAQ